MSKRKTSTLLKFKTKADKKCGSSWLHNLSVCRRNFKIRSRNFQCCPGPGSSHKTFSMSIEVKLSPQGSQDLQHLTIFWTITKADCHWQCSWNTCRRRIAPRIIFTTANLRTIEIGARCKYLFNQSLYNTSGHPLKWWYGSFTVILYVSACLTIIRHLWNLEKSANLCLGP